MRNNTFNFANFVRKAARGYDEEGNYFLTRDAAANFDLPSYISKVVPLRSTMPITDFFQVCTVNGFSSDPLFHIVIALWAARFKDTKVIRSILLLLKSIVERCIAEDKMLELLTSLIKQNTPLEDPHHALDGVEKNTTLLNVITTVLLYSIIGKQLEITKDLTGLLQTIIENGVSAEKTKPLLSEGIETSPLHLAVMEVSTFTKRKYPEKLNVILAADLCSDKYHMVTLYDISRETRDELCAQLIVASRQQDNPIEFLKKHSATKTLLGKIFDKHFGIARFGETDARKKINAALKPIVEMQSVQSRDIALTDRTGVEIKKPNPQGFIAGLQNRKVGEATEVREMDRLEQRM